MAPGNGRCIRHKAYDIYVSIFIMTGLRSLDPAFSSAQRCYFSVGAEVQPYDMDPATLEHAHNASANLYQALGQEMCGWVNVERYFVVQENDEAREVATLAREAFGRAYDLYEEDGGVAGQFRLQLVHAHLEEYELYAEDAPIDREIKNRALVATSEVGQRILEFYNNDPALPLMHESAMTRTVNKVVAILGLGLKAGDTRDPNAAMVVIPATMRQEVATPPGVKSGQDRQGSCNWTLNVLKSSPKGWQEQRLLLPQHEIEQQMPRVIKADQATLGNAEIGSKSSAGIYDVLRAMVLYYQGSSSPLDTERVVNIGKNLQRAIKTK